MLGNYANSGEEWERRKGPRRVRTHDFPDRGQGSACLYGIYDLARNSGWVNVGISHNTAQFAVASIRSWWQKLGHARYPRAKNLAMTPPIAPVTTELIVPSPPPTMISLWPCAIAPCTISGRRTGSRTG